MNNTAFPFHLRNSSSYGACSPETDGHFDISNLKWVLILFEFRPIAWPSFSLFLCPPQPQTITTNFETVVVDDTRRHEPSSSAIFHHGRIRQEGGTITALVPRDMNGYARFR